MQPLSPTILIDDKKKAHSALISLGFRSLKINKSKYRFFEFKSFKHHKNTYATHKNKHATHKTSLFEH